jgi:hypothetical protein
LSDALAQLRTGRELRAASNIQLPGGALECASGAGSRAAKSLTAGVEAEDRWPLLVVGGHNKTCRRTGRGKPSRQCQTVATDRRRYYEGTRAAAATGPVCSAYQCARVDSNHHGEISPQGPQPYSRVPHASARVQIVRFVRICGHIGGIGRTDLCQRCVTPGAAELAPGSPELQRPPASSACPRPVLELIHEFHQIALGSVAGADLFEVALEVLRFAALD